MKNLISMNKYFLLILIIFFLFFSIKNNFFYNISQIIKFNENERISKLYGHCKGESIGYLKFVNNKINFKSNPKIINYDHTPPSLWSIFKSDYNNDDSDFIILLNYPGNEINLSLKKNNENLFEIKDVYFQSLISNNIKYLIIKDNFSKSIEIEFYELDMKNKLSKVKTINLVKKNNEKFFELNQNFNEFNVDDNRLFMKIKNVSNSKIKIILENKYLIKNYNLINKYENCYVLKND